MLALGRWALLGTEQTIQPIYQLGLQCGRHRCFVDQPPTRALGHRIRPRQHTVQHIQFRRGVQCGEVGKTGTCVGQLGTFELLVPLRGVLTEGVQQ